MPRRFAVPRPVVAAALVVFIAAGVAFDARVLLVCVVGAFVVAYLELQRVLGARPTVVTTALGAAAVGVSGWIGFAGRLRDLPWVLGALAVSLFVARVISVETGLRTTAGAAAELGATITAAGIVGLLGAHVLLIRRLPLYGQQGLVVFALMIVATAVVAYAGRRFGRRPIAPAVDDVETWERAALGVAASIVVGTVAAAVWGPPFGTTMAIAVGAAVGILVPAGRLAVGALERSGGVRSSGTYLPGGSGLLDVSAGLLFSAPFYYWALRTLVV